ncbi:lipopolysaccharide transport system permease protein [Nonlabens dokdonensis]|uniref:ABC transporter permease protein n=2 Tax=Nonlabens dokdonensis TaxID=328515 RepID=L7WBX0_NONDD|nr:ABC transporter permease protein [Nonlabens dokdonensis DSW-6]PZX40922.1 lipopolysaccharide transport system permease protein [Nonlabens dokdonensis]
MSLETKIYQRGNSLNLMQILKDSLSDIYKSRFLAKQLATRDIKSQYRESLLGIFWAFVTPLSTALVWIFINKSGAVSLDDTGVPYPLFVFAGTLMWSTLTDAINMPMMATRGSLGIMSKINFPKEALLVSGFYKLLFNSSFKILLIVFFFFFFSVSLSWYILLFPLTFLILNLAGISVGLLITPIGLLYNDVSKFISLSLRFIMYVTPVVYTIPETGLMKTLMEWNPLTPLILINRNVLLGLELSFLNYFIGIALVTIPLLLLGLLIYRVSIPVIVERFNA